MTISPIPVFKDKNRFLTDIPGTHTLTPCFPTLWFSVHFMILPSVKKKKKRSVDFEIPGAIILLLLRGDRDVMWLNISAVTTGVFVSVAPFVKVVSVELCVVLHSGTVAHSNPEPYWTNGLLQFKKEKSIKRKHFFTVTITFTETGIACTDLRFGLKAQSG